MKYKHSSYYWLAYYNEFVFIINTSFYKQGESRTIVNFVFITISFGTGFIELLFDYFKQNYVDENVSFMYVP